MRPKNYEFGKEETALAATTLLVFALIFFPYLLGMNPGDGGRTYGGRGSVIHVDQEEKKVTLKHGDVDGVIPAMTMDYEVDLPEMLQELKAGDEVRFQLRPAGFEFVVVEIGKEGKS